MPAELRLVNGNADDVEASTKFAPDRRVPARAAQGSFVLALVLGLATFLLRSPDDVRDYEGPMRDRGPLRLALAVAAVLLFMQGAWAALVWLRRASIRYTLSSQRLEIERGLVARRRESVDLFRVRDVVLDQSFFERLRGLGTVTLYSTDQVAPTLALAALPDAQALYEKLRDAASRARQQRVVQLDR